LTDQVFWPVVLAAKGAYTVERLARMPFGDALSLWETIAHHNTSSWNASEPKRYKPQKDRDTD
jgi:hypothetical protein